MTSQEFVQSWNDAFPRAKVSQNDISNPTEAFLIKCLVNLFRSISIDVDFADFDPGSTDQDTLKKNKLHLFQYVNDMYRSLHNKKFLYFDLIHPTPKKTLNLLNSLLNYVLYYHMVVDELSTDTKELINRHRELLDKKKQLQKERERNKIQIQQGQKAIEELTHQLDEVNSRIAEERKDPSQKNFEENMQLKTKHTQRMAALKVHVAELTSQYINEEDYAAMKSSIFEIQEALSEKQEALEKLTANHESLCLDIAALEKKTALMETVAEMIPEGKSIDPGKLNEKKEELIRAMNTYEENKKKIQDTNSHLERFQQELCATTKKQIQLNEGWAEKLAPMEKVEEVLTDQLEAAKETADRLKLYAEQAKEDLKFMQENVKIGLELLRKSPAGDIIINDENSPRNS